MSYTIPTITLNNHKEMPLCGLGVYRATGENEVETAIAHALAAGYRLIDTASAYKNEDGVGRAIKSSSLPREELFITTKIWNTAQRIGNVESAFARSLERLQLSYVDLYLIHWPVPGCYLNTWKHLEKIYESGPLESAISIFPSWRSFLPAPASSRQLIKLKSTPCGISPSWWPTVRSTESWCRPTPPWPGALT